MQITELPLALLRQLEFALYSIADFNQVHKSLVAVRTREEVEYMVMLSVMSEMAGLSLAPPQLILGLLPHMVPGIYQWRRRVYGLADLSGEVPLGC